MKIRNLALCGAAALSACGGGGSGVQTPDQVQGVWAADCATPFVSFAGDKIHVYPDNATYDIKSAALQGSNLVVSYDTPQGAITETYALEGNTLRLDHGTYSGQEATWHKAAMSKCS